MVSGLSVRGVVIALKERLCGVNKHLFATRAAPLSTPPAVWRMLDVLHAALRAARLPTSW